MFRERIYVLSLVVFLISNSSIASDKTLKYISPGLRIGYEFGRGLTIGFKFSFGININTDYDFDNSAYYNITFGVKSPLFRKAKYLYEKYNFIELQAGYTPFSENLLFLGGGLGFMFYQDSNKTRFRPMVTIDSGWLIFAAFDFIFLENKKISTDFGFLGIMPIPLNKLDLGFN